MDTENNEQSFVSVSLLLAGIQAFLYGKKNVTHRITNKHQTNTGGIKCRSLHTLLDRNVHYVEYPLWQFLISILCE